VRSATLHLENQARIEIGDFTYLADEGAVACKPEWSFHPFAELLPLVEGKQFEELVVSIDQNGLLTPIVLFGGRILDGRNRFRALERLGRKPIIGVDTQNFTGDEEEALRLVVGLNVQRRHLSASQRAMIAADIATLRQGERGANSLQQVSEQLNVSDFLIKAARKLKNKVAPHILSMVQDGSISLSCANAVAGLPQTQQQGLCSAECVRDAAELQRSKTRRFGRASPEKILQTILDAVEEPFVRGSVADFLQAAGTDVASQLEICIERMHALYSACQISQ
jgi:ParB family chromosome partitioning protein